MVILSASSLRDDELPGPGGERRTDDEYPQGSAAALVGEPDAIARATEFLEVGQTDEAVKVVLAGWVGALTGPGFRAVDAFCLRLPASFAEDPRILAMRACAQDALGAHDIARMLLARAHASDANSAQVPGAEWHLAFADMVLVDDRAQLTQASERAWDLYSAGVELDLRSRTAALHHIGWAYLRHRHNPDRGLQVLSLAMRESATLGDDVLSRRAARQLACMLAWSGRLRDAQGLLDDLDDVPENATPWMHNTDGAVAAAMGTIAYWTNDVELARTTLAQLPEGTPSVVSFAATARLMLLLTAAASKSPELIRRATIELQSMPVGDGRGLEWEAFRQLAHAVLAEASGNRGRAVAIARKLMPHDSLPLVGVVCAGILRRAGDVGEALQILQRLQRYQQLPYVRVAGLVTAAMMHFQQGRTQVAHELCEHALESAERENIRRPFCEWDLDLRRLLTEHLAWGTQHETFIVGCLSDHTDQGQLGELTPRERAVTAQLRTTRSVPEIAAELGVSTNTVKTQLKSVYRKLGVTTRRDAVSVLSSGAH